MAKQREKKAKAIREGGNVKGGTEGGKGKRVPTQPPGMPQGKHTPRMDNCQCGRCRNERLVTV